MVMICRYRYKSNLGLKVYDIFIKFIACIYCRYESTLNGMTLDSTSWQQEEKWQNHNNIIREKKWMDVDMVTFLDPVLW
jgi:hypothetical protein